VVARTVGRVILTFYTQAIADRPGDGRVSRFYGEKFT